TVSYAAWRGSRHREPRQPRAILVAAATDGTPASTPAPTPPPAQTPATPAPKSDPDVRDTSKSRVRSVIAHVVWQRVGWNEQRRSGAGAAVVIQFNAPAAPIELIGKAAAPGTATIAPEVAGVWKWLNAQQLAFEAQGGWMPPRDYDFHLGKDGFAKDCAITLKKEHWNDWHAPKLTASFGEKSFYVDPATPALQQTVATVTFSQPVSREEVVRCLSVVNMSRTPLFVPGGKPQVIVDEKYPLRFYLRSPLIKPGE